jgi:hypothetical protein
LRVRFSENRFPPPIKSGAGFFGTCSRRANRAGPGAGC